MKPAPVKKTKATVAPEAAEETLPEPDADESVDEICSTPHSTFVRAEGRTSRGELFSFIPHFRSLQDEPNLSVIRISEVTPQDTAAGITVAALKDIWVSQDSADKRVAALDLNKCTMYGRAPV